MTAETAAFAAPREVVQHLGALTIGQHLLGESAKQVGIGVRSGRNRLQPFAHDIGQVCH